MNIDAIWEILIVVGIASAGGLARLLSHKEKTKLSIIKIFSELFISAFAGYMAFLFAKYLKLEPELFGLMSGIAGWMGPNALNIITKLVFKGTEVKTEISQDGLKSVKSN